MEHLVVKSRHEQILRAARCVSAALSLGGIPSHWTGVVISTSGSQTAMGKALTLKTMDIASATSHAEPMPLTSAVTLSIDDITIEDVVTPPRVLKTSSRRRYLSASDLHILQGTNPSS